MRIHPDGIEESSKDSIAAGWWPSEQSRDLDGQWLSFDTYVNAHILPPCLLDSL